MPDVYVYLTADGRETDAIAEAASVIRKTTDDEGKVVRERTIEFVGPRPERPLSEEQRQKAQAEFHKVLNDPRRWRDKGRELLASVACMRPRVETSWKAHAERNEPAGKHFDDVYGTYFMLVAFALENYCKAILLQRGLTVDPVDPELPKALKTHRLPKLLAAIGIKVDLWGQGLLERLTRASTWAGRYPVPSKAEHLARSHAIGFLLGVYTFDDLRDLDRLVEGVERAVDKTLGPEE